MVASWKNRRKIDIGGPRLTGNSVKQENMRNGRKEQLESAGEYQTLEDIRTELDRFEAAYAAGTLRTTGNWSAGQILDHCGRWIKGSIDGIDFRIPIVLRVLGRLIVKPLARAVEDEARCEAAGERSDRHGSATGCFIRGGARPDAHSNSIGSTRVSR